ncbi:MAG: ThiF family adenylyltransferase [Planctomycetes bacterium]|nr:ThiF family adenylyltransferase [Planctomycetota bacterium]
MPSTDANAGPILAAGEAAFRSAFLDRSAPLLGDESLRGKTVGIAGCGGVGGAVAITLARMGVQKFRLADPGHFDLPDLNRQWGATTRTLGANKAEVYREILESINPFAEVAAFDGGIQAGRVEAFVEGLDLLVDSLDLSVPLGVRERMFACAHARGAFSITAPIMAFGTLVAVSAPDGSGMEPFLALLEHTARTGRVPSFVHEHLSPEHLETVNTWLTEKRVKVPSIAVAPMAAGSIVATEAFKALSGRAPTALPEVILFDLFRLRCNVVDLDEVLAAPLC